MKIDLSRDYFVERVNVRATGCWIWAGYIRPDGYAVTMHKRRTTELHRLAYGALVGELVDGMHIDHLCHTNDPECEGGPTCPHRACLNPDHLEQVTPEENGRRAKARVTHCPQGHPYSGWNLLDYGHGRACRTCVYARNRLQPRKPARPCLGGCGKKTVVDSQVCHRCQDAQVGAA